MQAFLLDLRVILALSVIILLLAAVRLVAPLGRAPEVILDRKSVV